MNVPSLSLAILCRLFRFVVAFELNMLGNQPPPPHSLLFPLID